MSFKQFCVWFWQQPGNDPNSDMAKSGQYDEIVCEEYDLYLKKNSNAL